jgi:hypothetical protein
MGPGASGGGFWTILVLVLVLQLQLQLQLRVANLLSALALAPAAT